MNSNRQEKVMRDSKQFRVALGARLRRLWLLVILACLFSPQFTYTSKLWPDGEVP
jgi:hypothetical protein